MVSKIVAVGDLHGEMPKLRYREFDCILSIGDFCPSLSRDLMFENIQKKLKDPEFDGNWWDPIGLEEAERRSQKEMKIGRRIVEKLASYGKPVITIPGNSDFPGHGGNAHPGASDYYNSFLLKGLKNVKDSQMKLVRARDFTVIGYGGTYGPEVPVEESVIKKIGPLEMRKKERELKALEGRFDSLFSKAPKKKPVIFLSHNVPYDTPIDRVGEESPRRGQHFGSMLTRKMIEKHQPLLCLGGHMHDSRGTCTIGDTLCINIGLGAKANIFFEVEKSRLKGIKGV